MIFKPKQIGKLTYYFSEVQFDIKNYFSQKYVNFNWFCCLENKTKTTDSYLKYYLGYNKRLVCILNFQFFIVKIQT